MEGRTGASDWIHLWLLMEFVAAGLQNALSSGQIPEKDERVSGIMTEGNSS
jgi:hypothetical protein